MKTIKLTQDKLALIDDEDFERVNQFKWYFEHGYARRDVKRKRIYMHRFIAGVESGKEIDHINRNKLDNRKENLREITHQRNSVNRGRNKNNTSGYTGVIWDSVNNKWTAQISYGKRHINLGRFVDKIEAARAYDNKAKELFGEFAYLNLC